MRMTYTVQLLGKFNVINWSEKGGNVLWGSKWRATDSPKLYATKHPDSVLVHTGTTHWTVGWDNLEELEVLSFDPRR